MTDRADPVAPRPRSPWVVGTIKPQGLAALAAQGATGRAQLPDLIEARLDLAPEVMGSDPPRLPEPAGFLRVCRELEAVALPVLLTIRRLADGGRWTGDEDRLSFFEAGCAGASWLDIEVESRIAPAVVSAAHAAGRRAIVSHHDFAGTPDVATLEELNRRAAALGADIVKLAVMVNRLDDHAMLVDFIHRMRAHEPAVAVIAMGPLGRSLRSYLPCIGSRLTYGYLDDVAAPGQPPAGELVTRLLADCPAYAASRRPSEE